MGADALAFRAAFGVNLQERAHGLFRSRAGDTAFGGDAELRRVTARCRDPRLGSRRTVLGVNHAEKERSTGRQFQIAKRAMKRVVAAFDRYRHMNVSRL